MKPRAARRPLVLLVDPDVTVALGLAQRLREDGFDVDIARGATKAIARLARGRAPDALITDVSLPRIDGLAVVCFARARFASLPVFLLASDPLRTIVVTEEGPLPVVLTKPVDYAGLSRRLRGAAVLGSARSFEAGQQEQLAFA